MGIFIRFDWDDDIDSFDDIYKSIHRNLEDAKSYTPDYFSELYSIDTDFPSLTYIGRYTSNIFSIDNNKRIVQKGWQMVQGPFEITSQRNQIRKIVPIEGDGTCVAFQRWEDEVL